MGTRNLLVTPKLFYLSWYTAIGVFAPFITLYYRQTGLDLAQIGLLGAIAGTLPIIAGPLWGVLADALRLHKVMLPLVLVGVTVPVFLIGRVSGFLPLLALASLYAFLSAPVTPLGDSAVLTLLGERRERYGAQRVWGAVGWGVSTVVSGIVVGKLGLSVIFLAFPVFGLLTALISTRLPGATLATTDVAGAARSLLRDVRWARFLGCTLLVGVAGALTNGFFSLYLSELGADSDRIGLAFTLASVSELPVMALAPLVFRRWGARPLLVCAGVFYALRLTIYALAPGVEWALGAQLLHGFCFASMWIAGVSEAQRLAPGGFAATAQSLFGIAIYGLSGVIANAVGGVVYQTYGHGALFGFGAALALLGALGFLIPIAEPAAEPAPAG